MLCKIYADQRFDHRFVLPNFSAILLGLGKPDCVGIELGLRLEVVFRSIHHVHAIMI